jgi:hypothetical protein
MRKFINSLALSLALTVVVYLPTAVQSATVLHGLRARSAAEKALLPFIEQYHLIPTIHFAAEIDKNSSSVLGRHTFMLTLSGRYRFWSKGDLFRINWREFSSSYQPLEDEVWAFDGSRYQSIIRSGPDAGLVISRHRPIGFFGPGEPNPLLCPIFNMLQRVTKRQPGNWLDYWRVRHQPLQVDQMPDNIAVKSFQFTAHGAQFVWYPKTVRYPHSWPWKSPTPPWFRAGGHCLNCVVLRRRGAILLPVADFPPCPQSTKIAQLGGVRFRYAKFMVGRTGLYLPIEEDSCENGHWSTEMKMRHLALGGRVNPAIFTINYLRAQYFIQRNRTIPIGVRPLLPPQVQHLGPN